MRLQFVILLTTSFIGSGLWFGLKPLDLPSAKALQQTEDQWRLDAGESMDADEALSRIASGHLFGAPPAAPGVSNALPVVEEKPLTPPNWRIAGVYASGGQPVALLAVEGEPTPRALHVGDKLPGGAKLLRIGPDRLCISLNGKIRSLTPYQE